MIAISLAVDAPKGLDEGQTAIAYEGASASLLEGFWMQIATGAVLIACGLLLPLYLRPAPAGAAARSPPGRPRPAVIASRAKDVARAGAGAAAEARAAREAEAQGAGEGQGRRDGRGGDVSEAGITRATRLLPVAVIAAAICLFASELMTVFEFTPPGAEPLCAQGGADRHGNALMVLAVFAIVALAIAVFARLEAGRDRGRGLRRGGAADLPDRRPAGRQRAGIAERGLRRARRLVHRRRGGAAGRLLPRAGRLAGARP